MNTLQLVTIVTLFAFAAFMMGIGVYSMKGAKSIDGFLLGGRKIGPWLSAFSYGTSYFSAVIFIGYAGKNGWDVGFASIWIGVGNAVLGCLLAWLVLAKRTRQMTYALKVKTMPEFFQHRYQSQFMKIFAAIIIFVFLVPYSSAVYRGLGSMFNTIFPNVPVNYCMLFVALLTSFFLVMGGYVASAYTDFFQGLIMIVGVLLMVVIITINPVVGGFGAAFTKIKAIDPQLVNVFGGKNWSFLLTNILLTSFGTWGLPQMVNKYYAVKDNEAIKKATVVSTIFAAIIGFGAYYTGSLGRLYLNNALPKGGYDFVVPNILLNALGGDGILPNLMLAVIMILLLSASMSTLSSIVLTSASAISVDLLPYVSKSFNKNNQIGITRILCFAFVLLSYIFATLNIAIIVSIMSFSWGIVSGSFIGPFIWGLCSKKTTQTGAIAGLLGGFLTVALLTLYDTVTVSFAEGIKNAPIHGVLAMGVSLLLVPIVSSFTKKLPEHVVKNAFQ